MSLRLNQILGGADIRAPIFYDSANTSYYVDPASTSVLYSIAAGAAGNSSANIPALKVTSAGTATTQAAIAIQQQTSEGDTIIFCDFDQYVEWNLVHENANNQLIVHGGSSTSNLGSNTFYSPNGTAKTGYIKHVFDMTDGNAYIGGSVGIGTNGPAQKLDVRGTIISNADVRAPIFYDSANTTYYIDPGSTTSLRTVGSWRSDSAAWDGEFNGKIQYHANHWYFQSGDLWLFRNSGGSNVVSISQGGIVNLSGITGAGNTYIQTSTTGTSYTSHFQIREANGGGGNTSEIYAPALGFHWSGVVASNILMEASGRIAIRNNPGSGYENFIAAIVYAGSSVQAPIFYDSNDTTYYLDPASSTSLNIAGQITTARTNGTLLSIAGADTFGYNSTAGRGTYIKGTSTTYVYGSGVYYDGSNIRQMLYEDTWLNNKYFDSNGIIYSQASMRAPIFYDYNDTSYYLDPNGGSVLKDINLNLLQPRSGVTHSDIYAQDAIINSYYHGDALTYDVFQFNAASLYEVKLTSTHSFSSTTVETSIFKGDRFGGMSIANNTYQVRWTWSNTIGYKFFKTLYLANSTNGNSFSVTIEYSGNGSTWSTLATSGQMSNWPGHSWYNYAWNNNAAQGYIRLTITPTWNNGNSIDIYNMRYFCSYNLDASTRLYDWDYSRNVTFPAFVDATQFRDTNNTAYYIDAASTSNLVGLTVANTITGSITGNAGGSSASCTGNAATATILQTARTIGGVSFNGSANINLPGVNTAGNQNTTGTASNVTGTVAIANGGTGATTNANARTNLGATTVGSNLFTLTNPSAITFLRVNADNTVSALNASDFRNAIGAGGGGVTVETSVTQSLSGTTGCTIDVAAANVHILSLANATTISSFTYNNRSNNPSVNTLMIVLKYAGNASITWTNVIWSNNINPTLTQVSGYADVFMLTSYKGGAGTPVWIGTVVAAGLVSTNL